MNWVDIVIISVIGFSALLAFMRGLVRELLGIGSWVAAGFFAAWALPYVLDRFHGWIAEKDAEVVGFGAMFVIALIVLSVVSSIVGGVVRASLLGGLDRTLGVVFGLVRGVGVVIVAYIVVGMAVSPDRWPPPVQDARMLPYVYDGAVLATGLLPEDYRPAVRVPPATREAKAAEFLRLNPQGRAIARP